MMQTDSEQNDAQVSPETPHPQTLIAAGSELMRLSIPFILSMSFTTIQMFIDRIFIAGINDDAMAATMPSLGYFWAPFALFQFTVLYVTVFVAQYIGANRPQRVGPVVWQGLYFAVIAGCLFPALIPVVDAIIDVTGHKPEVMQLERVYFRSLCLAALPMLIVAAVNGFFSGRQQSWTVLMINCFGALVNVIAAIPLIYLQKHDPERAMFGAGLAAVCGGSASALLGLFLLFRKRYQAEFAILSGWRFDRALFLRLMKFGLPNGAQFCIEGIAFTAFIVIIGRIGTAELAASTLTFSLNMLTFLPVMGLGQGVEVLVGRRQGENRPDISARTVHAGVILATIYMFVISFLYCAMPSVITYPFAMEMKAEEWAKVGPLIPVLLRFVAAYSLADGANIIYAFGLRGAGDTRFVTFLAIALSWPLMVIPTWLCWKYGWGLQAAWSFATLYVVALALAFGLRFFGGKWRTMKVIEPVAVVDTAALVE